MPINTLTNNLKVKKKPGNKYLIYCINLIHTEPGKNKDNILPVIESYILEGYVVLIVFYKPDNFSELDLRKNQFLSDLCKLNIKLNHEEINLLLYCQSLISSSVLSQELKALNYKTAFLPGFRIAKYDSVKSEYIYEPDIIKNALNANKAVIISSTFGFDQKRNLNILNENEFYKFIMSLKKDISAKIEESFDNMTIRNLNPKKGYKIIADSESFEKKTLLFENPFEKRKTVSGIIIVLNALEVKLDFSLCKEPEILKQKVLQSFAIEGISLDMINICYDSIYFIINDSLANKATEIIDRFNIPKAFRKNLSKLSITGVGMKGTPGVMAKIYDVLESKDIDILRNTDSHITISCLIKEEDLPTALEMLMKKFNLSPADLSFENTYK